MYVALVSVILGPGLWFGSVGLLEYWVLVGVWFHLFVVAYEEPKLRGTFGAEYEDFCKRVPQWLPGLGPWIGPTVSEQPRTRRR